MRRENTNDIRFRWSWALTVGIYLTVCQPAFAAPCPELRTRSFIGEARSLDGRAALYAEHHAEAACGASPVSLETRYVDGSGASRAVRRLRYDQAPTPWAPAFSFIDERSGRREEARVEGREVVIRLRERQGGETKTARIPYTPDLVIDGGFDRFIRANLTRLRRGEAVTFRFVVPAQLDAYEFAIERDAFPAGTSGATHLPLVLRINNWFVRMLVDPIRVVYALEPFELQRYIGLSNVRDENGNLFEAVLTYPPAAQLAAWKTEVR